MSASKLQKSCEVRIKHSLNKEEEEFIVTRRKSVFPTLGNLEAHCNQNKMPNIALLGSGGGQRAMVGLLGSLVQLDKAGHLDCNLYLSGVSGSTWCMASLYQEPGWSTKLETVKDKIIKRLSGPGVSFTDKLAKLKKYYYEKDIFSLTDVWAVLIVTEYVKEIDEQKLSKKWDKHSKDPFPIYTVIDKQCKQCKDEKDVWFEISPLEAGYSLTGAFVETSSFGSQFDNGSKKKQQPEMDMLYLQALCGSALADEEEIRKFIWQKIKDFFHPLFPKTKTILEEMGKDPNDPLVEKCCQVLMDLVDKNLSVLNGIDPSAYDKSIRKTLKALCGSALADEEEIRKFIWQKIKDFFHPLFPKTKTILEEMGKDPNDPLVEKCCQVLMDLVDKNLSVLNGIDPSAYDKSIRKTLKALCGSALADEEEIRKFIWQKIKDFFHPLFPKTKTILEEMGKDPNDPLVEKCCQVLMDLVDKNLSVLNGIDPSAYDKSIRKTLKELAEGKGQLIFPVEKLDLADKEAAKQYMEQYTTVVCNYLSSCFSFWPFDVCISICRCMAQWIWGRKYNFFHNMTDETVPDALLESETRDYEDAAVLLNSPYFSVLRDERDIDLIISLDFSEGDPFKTLTQTAEMCKKQKIHFPDVPMFPEEEKKNPKDLYVFTGQNAPTVIHIPLFNVANCGGEIEAWRKKYHTFQGAYSAEMITELMEVAGKNISNNTEKLSLSIPPVTDTTEHT